MFTEEYGGEMRQFGSLGVGRGDDSILQTRILPYHLWPNWCMWSMILSLLAPALSKHSQYSMRDLLESHRWSREKNSTDPHNEIKWGVICKRCVAFDIGRRLQTVPWRTSQPHLLWHERIGEWQNLVYDENCPACNLIEFLVGQGNFQATDNLILAEARVLHRIDKKVRSYRSNNEGYSKVLFVYRSEGIDPVHYEEIQTAASQAITAVSLYQEKNLEGDPITFTGRARSNKLDTNLILHWLNVCTTNHGSVCRPIQDPRLKHIRLIDVHTRYVVPYPSSGYCKYFCLSYVWGAVKQKRCSLGELPTCLPTTIVDSMQLVRRLGMRYLWVDSVSLATDYLVSN
jgi:hypothetical protein